MNVKMIMFALLLGTLLACGSGGGNDTGEKPAPHLVSLAVTPAGQIISRGNTRQFIATGTYTDNTSHDLTSSATWSSSNTAVATIETDTMRPTSAKRFCGVLS